jgi:hypothetical protein
MTINQRRKPLIGGFLNPQIHQTGPNHTKPENLRNANLFQANQQLCPGAPITAAPKP